VGRNEDVLPRARTLHPGRKIFLFLGARVRRGSDSVCCCRASGVAEGPHMLGQAPASATTTTPRRRSSFGWCRAAWGRAIASCLGLTPRMGSTSPLRRSTPPTTTRAASPRASLSTRCGTSTPSVSHYSLAGPRRSDMPFRPALLRISSAAEETPAQVAVAVSRIPLSASWAGLRLAGWLASRRVL
jgi:hypothetical protein